MFWGKMLEKLIPTQPKANGRLFPVPKGTVAMGGGRDNLRSETTPRSQPAVPSPPATYSIMTVSDIKHKMNNERCNFSI